MMGQHDHPKPCSITSASKIRFPNIIFRCYTDQAHQLEVRTAALKDSYSETGRPSIDPELLLRILLIGYLYGASPANANWWRNWACIWRGAGSRDWVSIRRSRTTPRFENRHGRS